MQLPLNGPRLIPSQDSPVSIAAFPHLGLSVQLDVSSWHVKVHLRVPPLKEELKLVHVFIWPNTFPSQDSPGSNCPLPQSGTLVQLDESILQLSEHFRVPPIKLVNCVHLLINPKVSLSHSSPGWFIRLSPHTGCGLTTQSSVLILHEAHFIFPPTNPLLYLLQLLSVIFPKLFPSHISPVSSLLLPHVGSGVFVQPTRLNVQSFLHDN